MYTSVIDRGDDADGSSDSSAYHSSMLAAAGINVTRNPAQPTELAIVAIGPEGGVLGPAMAAGRAADAVGLHLAPDVPEADNPKRDNPKSDYRVSDYRLAELAPSPLPTATAIRAARAPTAKLGLRAVVYADRAGLLVGAPLSPHL